MAARYWMGGTGTWDTTTTANWSATFPSLVTASCSGTTLTTIGSPALVVGNTVRLTAGGTSLGTITGGSGNSWTVSVGGTYAQQSMLYATVGASVPTTSDATTFLQFTGVTVTLSGALNCAGINGLFTGTFDGTGTINFGTATFSIQNTVTWSATGLLTFTGNTTMTTNGVTINSPITTSTGTFTLGGALTLSSGNTFTLTSGTLSLVSYTLTTGFFSSSSATGRAISFGTGNITVNGAGGTLWDTGTSTNLTTSGTQVVNVSYSGAVATTVSSGSPNETNSISFNFTTGTYSLTHTAGAKRNLNFTGFAGTVSNTAQTIYGNLTLASGATYTAGANSWSFNSTSAGKTITTNGKTMDFPLVFGGTGGSWVLQDALTMGASRGLNHGRGTIDLNGKTLTVGSQYAITTAGAAKNLTFNGGTLICPAASAIAFNNGTPADFTTTAGTGTGTISMTAATAKTFVGGGSTFNCTLNQGGAGALTITGANTFDNITNTVQPASVLFTAGTTTTFNNFNLNGTAGNLITIASATAATHTLSKASGTVSCDYLSITNSIATGGASWYAGANSFNGGSNTGWIFTAPPGGGVNVNVTGVFASGVVGTATVAAAANILTTGPPATGNVGTVATTGVANVTLTGVSAQAINDGVGVSAGGSISVDVFGNAATGTVGTVATTGLANVTLTGVPATGSVGTATASIPTSVTLTGVSATGFVGTVTVVFGASVTLTGVSAAGAVGTVRVSIPKSVTLTGVSATGAIGTSTVATAATLFPALFVNQNVFYSATVTPGSVDIAPALFTNQNAFYAVTASATYSLAPALLQNVNQFFTASTYQYWSLLPGTIPSSNQFFSPVVYRGAPTPNWHREATAGDENFTGIDMIANPSLIPVPTSPTPNFTLDSQTATPNWIQQ